MRIVVTVEVENDMMEESPIETEFKFAYPMIGLRIISDGSELAMKIDDLVDEFIKQKRSEKEKSNGAGDSRDS